MQNAPWSDGENDLLVADYFTMLRAESLGETYNKSAHRRALLSLLKDRNEKSIEFKHCNVSAVLKGLGERWIKGYKPAFNFQTSLIDAVARWLVHHPDWTLRRPMVETRGLGEAATLFMEPAPTLENSPPPDELEQMQYVARKFDAAGRDARNRRLGRAGEELVVSHERAVLRKANREDLANEVVWVSDRDGDGAGYDIASFDISGNQRLIEVKTTNGWARTPFHISRNELECSESKAERWCLMRVWNFESGPRAFELRAPLERHVSLVATSYLGSFH